MILMIQNLTTQQKAYLSGTFILPASGLVSAPMTSIFQLSRDSSLVFDSKNGNVILSDSVNQYAGNDAVEYLNAIASALGSQVIGYIGTTAPNFAILVGSKDVNGNIQSASIDPQGGIIIGGEGTAGTPVGGIFTVQGVANGTALNTNLQQIGGTNSVTAGISGLLAVGGNAASLSSDSGNPIKVGSVYNSAGVAPTTGQRVDLQSNQFGELSINQRNLFRNVTGNGTTVVKTGSGTLHMICINNNTTGGNVVVYDNTAGSGTKIGNFTIGSPSGGLLSTSGQPGPINMGPLGLEFSTGLTVVTSGSSNNDVTLIYK